MLNFETAKFNNFEQIQIGNLGLLARVWMILVFVKNINPEMD